VGGLSARVSWSILGAGAPETDHLIAAESDPGPVAPESVTFAYVAVKIDQLDATGSVQGRERAVRADGARAAGGEPQPVVAATGPAAPRS